jgi:hypothetical protein
VRVQKRAELASVSILRRVEQLALDGHSIGVVVRRLTPSFPGKGRALSCRPVSAKWARNRRSFRKWQGWVEPFTRTVGRPRGTG